MKQNDKRSAGLHVGSASLIMIFAVLCLMVFSTLSYMTALQEETLAQKSARAMEQYYAADWRCEETYEQIYERLAAGLPAEQLMQELDVQVTKQGAAVWIAYTEPIDEQQELQVVLVAEAGALRTEVWRVAPVEFSQYSDEITVWDGE